MVRGQAYPCVIKECNKTNKEKDRLCVNCRSWWYYHSIQSTREFERYLANTKKRWGRLFMSGFKQSKLRKKKIA